MLLYRNCYCCVNDECVVLLYVVCYWGNWHKYGVIMIAGRLAGHYSQFWI